ncbi:MAG: dTDP-4-dehydrorhamnose 3,5-epimerase [Parasphingorhabdus sp.]|jgi:dTDP-4-dehydrorhamnose 3,5-epimerase
MQVIETALPGVKVVEPTVFEDARGFFMEVYHREKFAEAGLPEHFVQDNHSRSEYGVIRGLHYQYPQWQGKLVRCVRGEIFDVAVDIRADSPHFGQWHGEILSEKNRRQLYVPPGFAHGFCVLSDIGEVTYKCTSIYKHSDDAGIRWNDPDVGIDWPIKNGSLSEKDANAPLLKEINLS